MRWKIREPQAKRYCYTCGAEVKRTFITYAYNEETGEAKQYEDRKCPNFPKTFIGRIFTSHHVERPIHVY